MYKFIFDGVVKEFWMVKKEIWICVLDNTSDDHDDCDD